MYQQSRANEMAMRRLLPTSLGFKAPLVSLPSLQPSPQQIVHPSIPLRPSPLATTSVTLSKTKSNAGDTGVLKKRTKKIEYVPVRSQAATIPAPLTMDNVLQQGERIIVSFVKVQLLFFSNFSFLFFLCRNPSVKAVYGLTL